MKKIYSHFLPCSFFIASMFCYSNAFYACHSVFSSPRRFTFAHECTSTMSPRQQGKRSDQPFSSDAVVKEGSSSCGDTTNTSRTAAGLEGFPDIVAVLSASMSAALLWVSIAVSPAYADGATKEFKLPPINLVDPNRCVLKSSAMGQANAARDSLYDLRQCSLFCWCCWYRWRYNCKRNWYRLIWSESSTGLLLHNKGSPLSH